MGSKGSQTTTTTQAPPAWANQYYQQLSQQAVNLGNQAYTPYTGQLTAPINTQQQTAIGNVNDLYPQVSGMISGAAQPLTAAQIQQYYNPYQQNVINATEAQFANTNAQQFNQADANAVMAGAYGGTGNVRAKAMLTQQQQLAEAPVIAGLEQQGYTQALGAAGQQFQQNPEQAAGLLASTGTNIANTQFGYGTAEQQTQQNALNAAYQQWLQQQAYPFQANAYAAGVVGGVGSLSGGTGTVTAPPPNPITQIAGVGATAAGAYMASDRRLKEDVHKVGETNDGQPIYRFRYKGSPQWHIGLMAQDVEKKHPEAVGEAGGYKMVDIKEATDEAVKRRVGGLVPGFAGGGAPGNMPYAGAPTYVPAEALPHGSGPPHPVSSPVDTSSNQIFQNAAKMAGSYKGGSGLSGPSYGGGNVFTDAYGGSATSPLEGLTAADYGANGGRVMRYGGLVLPTRNRIEFNRGGPIRAGLGFSSFVPRRGYQDGGSPATFDERFQGEAPPPDLIGGTIQGLEAAPITTQPVPPDGGTIMQPGLEPPAVVSPPASAPQAAPVQTAGVGQEEMPAIVTEGPRGVPSREDPRGQGPYIRQAAAKRGIDPDFAVFAAGTEGLRQFKSDIPGENSYGAFQLNTDGGLGNEFYKATRLDPSDPKNERATIDFALDHAAQHGWGAFHGVRNAGYGPWEGIGQPSSALALTNEEPTGGLGRRGADGSTTPPSPRGRTGGLATGQETPSGGGFGFGSHPDFGQALMAAGLGMMASRSPFLGVGIGEGGLAGLGAYGSLQRQHLAEQQLDRQNARETELERHARATEKETAGFHKATLEHQAETLRKPVKMTDKWGQEYLVHPDTGELVGPAPGGTFPTAPHVPPQGGPQTGTPAAPVSDQPKFIQVGAAEDANGLPATGAFNNDKPDHDVHPEALQDLDAGEAARVKAIAEGRAAALPTGSRNKYNQELMRKVYQYDPSYDGTAYGRRQRTANFFAVGTQGGGGQNIASMNTWAQHMDDYLRLTQEIGLGRFTTINEAYNWLTSHGLTGEEAQKKLGALEIAQKAVADEGAKIFAGSNSALGDREEWMRRFGLETPANVALAKAQEVSRLIGGRLSSLTNQYNQGMRTTHGDQELIAPRTRDVMKNILETKDHYTPIGAKQDKQATHRVTSKDEYDKLPSGATFTDENGKPWKKP